MKHPAQQMLPLPWILLPFLCYAEPGMRERCALVRDRGFVGLISPHKLVARAEA